MKKKILLLCVLCLPIWSARLPKTFAAETQVNGNRERRALLAYLNVRPGTEAQFLEAAKEVIVESRREPGTLVYNLHQSVNEPQKFLFYELYRSHEDLESHRKSQHVVNFLNRVKPILKPGGFFLVEYR